MSTHPLIANPAPLAVRLEGARLVYNDNALFDGLDVQLEAGRWTCLLGPSGVGKTTLLRVLAGLTEGVEGRITCSDGVPLAGRLVYMGQQDFLYPWLSAEANVALGARLRGETPDMARARALLDRVGLKGRERDRPATLSGGMRQRVALARTLMEDKPVVLMDEPFSALDSITRHRIQDLAASLLRGRTVLLVTHDPAEALRLGHRILVMVGAPVRIEDVPPPPGDTPRDPAAPELGARMGALLARLAAAAGA